MLTECPPCRTPYKIDEALIGRRGRRIRCRICEHRWVQRPAVAPVICVAERVTVPAPEPEDAWQIRAAPPANQPGRTWLPKIWLPKIGLPNFRAPALAILAIMRAAPSIKGLWRPAAVAASVLLPMLVIGQRERIVRHVPASAPIFAAAGLPVNLRGLEFRQVKSTLFTDDGQRTLAVEGVIAQVGRIPSKVPAVEIAVRDVSGRDLYTWTAAPQRQKLARGEEVLFRARLAAPPHAGAQVHLRFADANTTNSASRSPH